MYRPFSLLFLSVVMSLFLSTKGYGQFHNGSHLEFGKSRVQHTDFVWSFYKFKKYDVYFYTGGKDLAIYAANTAEQIIEETESFFDYSLDGKLQLIVFNKLSDLKQSNIGLATQEDANVGGGTRMVGSKIFIYFNGDHNHLEKQIRSGISEVLISQMIYGGSWKDRVKNSTLLTLPTWYMEGLISYVSEGWNTEVENRVRDGILSGRYKRFNRLSGIEATYAGHSIWNFITERYGSSLIPSILYMTKVSRNIESGMLFVLGSNLSKLSDDWLRFYQNKYFNTNKTKRLPTSSTIIKKPKANRIYSKLTLSPDGENAAFVTNIMGKYKVWVYNFESKKFKKVMKFGYKLDGLNDHTYPLLDWHPNSKLLSILSEKKDQLYLRYYFPETKKLESRPIHHFQKILSMSYSSDGKKFVMSGIKKGQTDIFIYHISKNTFENITNDIYDDYEPIYLHDDRDILFSSNRVSDTLHSSPNWQDNLPLRFGRKKDLFLYSASTKSKVMKRVTNTLATEESNPIRLTDKYISYLSDESGITNRVLVQFDSVISHVDTIAHYKFQTISTPVSNYSRNIIEQNAGYNGNKLGQILFSKGRYRMYVDTLSIESLLQESKNISFPSQQKKPLNQPPKSTEQNQNKSSTKTNNKKEIPIELPEDYIDINNYVFEIEKKAKPSPQNEKTNEETNTRTDIVQDTTSNQDTSKKKENLKTTLVRKINSMHVPSKQWNYNTAYSSDYFISQLDNRYLSSTYQKFTGGGAIYTNPGMNLFFKIGISDLLEDYRVVGGMRLSSNLTNNEFFLSYENLKKRLDKQLVLHRQTMVTFQSSGTGIKIQTHDARFVLKWPFTEIFFIKGAATIRNDRNVTLSTDISSLKEPNTFDTWGGFTGEVVFDNTIKKGLNLYNGTRTKIFAEWFKQVDQEETNLFVLGFDWRNYLKIHRDIIWANRLATSTSFGDQKLVYYMGGVDGWLKPTFNNNIDIAQDQNYAYQTLATNMRGFDQNIRNGNSFAVINSEIRFPIFKYFTKKPMKSDFLKNFQIVPFADIGTAWTGPNPYTQDNSFNTDNIQTGPLTIRLTHQREPIIAGYGMGLRTRVWGYFVRIDWARGIEDGILLDPMIYWSLNLDF